MTAYTMNETNRSRFGIRSINLSFRGIRITTPAFAERDYLCKVSDYAGFGTKYSINAVPGKFNAVYKPPEFPCYNMLHGFLPMTELGLIISSCGADLTLHVRNYEKFRNIVRTVHSVANWNSRSVWKVGFRGKDYISPEQITAQKAAFESSLRTIKLIRNTGSVTAGYESGITVNKAYNESSSAVPVKKTADIIMSGVAFVPGAGWIAAGMYFIGAVFLSNAGFDWWDDL